MRDCVNRLKQYIARCLDDEKPSQKRLISIFLVGLQNKTLHAHLYVKKHKKLNECCIDAMDVEDNMDFSNDSSQEEEPSGQQGPSRDLAPRATTTNLSLEKIVDIVMRRMGQLYHPPTPLLPIRLQRDGVSYVDGTIHMQHENAILL